MTGNSGECQAQAGRETWLECGATAHITTEELASANSPLTPQSDLLTPSVSASFIRGPPWSVTPQGKGAVSGAVFVTKPLSHGFAFPAKSLGKIHYEIGGFVKDIIAV